MAGSLRLEGGLGALTRALADRLPASRLRLNTPVSALNKNESGITASLSNAEHLTANRVVLAMPPRIAAKISYSPRLPNDAVQSMQAVSTWMAGHAKALAVYDAPFWRENGLSGDATSHCGPLFEIHDASPAMGDQFGLFGFIGVPPDRRTDTQALHQQIIAQLVRLFGAQAAMPATVYLKDWAIDPYTATTADLEPLYAHPDYGMPQPLKGLWDNTLLFAGTEVAARFGGYLEGALEASSNVLARLGDA